ncbi:MAG: carboxypeptidase regulatory-like domain-containing protein, partial [Acidobacteria bacterium]|nr:carboxypeptidase regulatory-like domain-containing protein [Acidobacteriota bacterium]
MQHSARMKTFSILIFLLAGFMTTFAQVPTGTIRGIVTDPSGAVLSGAIVTAKNKITGAERAVMSKSDGEFQLSNLLPGEYELKVTIRGFKSQLTSVTVQVGETVSHEIKLEIGETTETVVVSGDTTATVNTTDFKIDGVITRQKIDNLPLNGRNFLQLASLEPGVRVSTSNPGDANNLFNVSIGGASSALTRLTVDGGSVIDGVTGGAGQNFSVETIQEFQISTFNFDLATGVTSVGAVNIVSRTGGNDFHGSGFVFYRGNNISAYPVLQRDPKNPDPFFRRLQTGFSASGPIKKDKLLWFFNLEDLNQDGVFSTINT